MSYNYCTCSKDPNKAKLVDYGRTPYRQVLTNNEGICLDCGHYTIATSREVSPKGGQLYAYITGYRTDAEKLQRKQNWHKDRTDGWN